jgi:cell division protein FtsI (penicillin-binding protein 3)/stage V sporulation protein D (sporulation-specific penicillin-binding protein)
MNLGLKTRSLCATTLLAGVFTVFSWRLVDIQVAQHEHWSSLAARKNVQQKPIFARRGIILSADGEPLAQNEPVKQVIADGSLIKDHEAVAEILAPLLEMKKPALLEKLHRTTVSESTGRRVPSRYIVLKKDVPEEVALKIADNIAAAGQRGIFFEQDFRRYYPNGQMLSHVVGYVNSDNQGVAGIEQSLNDTLHGENGYRYFEHDRTGKELVLYRGQERAPRHGLSVRLTIEIGLQKIVESELEEAMKQFKPKFAVAMIQRPQTGEILAMASRPSYDPNKVPEVEAGKEKDTKNYTNPLINRAIAASYEPGSTFKIVATGASLNERLSNSETSIFCENGYYTRYKLKDHAPYGDLTVPMILIKSSNIGVCKLGVQLGEDRFYEYVRKFGFGQRTGINLPGEEAGLLAPPHRWSNLTISRMPMGHEIAVTPLQSICSMSVIANGGKLMVPQLIREVTDDEGHTVETMQPQVVRDVLRKQTVDVVQAALGSVVSKDGTARLAAVKGFKVAGKTGTAQVYNSDGSICHDRHRVSFVGYMPADAPEFACIVMLEQPITAPNQDMGGLVAAPIFSRIAERTARYMGLQPEPEPVLTAQAQTSKTRQP